MQANLLRRIYKLSGVIIIFHSIWFLLVMVIFLLIVMVEVKSVLIMVILPIMAIVSVLFTIYVNRKLKMLRKYQDECILE